MTSSPHVDKYATLLNIFVIAKWRYEIYRNKHWLGIMDTINNMEVCNTVFIFIHISCMDKTPLQKMFQYFFINLQKKLDTFHASYCIYAYYI